jgi:hypothetical protein
LNASLLNARQVNARSLKPRHKKHRPRGREHRAALPLLNATQRDLVK